MFEPAMSSKLSVAVSAETLAWPATVKMLKAFWLTSPPPPPPPPEPRLPQAPF